MKILWITSVLFPEAESLLTGNIVDLTASGGWLLGAADSISKLSNVDLHIACPARVNNYVKLVGNHITYHLYKGPMLHDWPENDAVWSEMLNLVAPDLIHIWGTEYASTLSVLRVAERRNLPSLISIQGFKISCAYHLLDGISIIDILKSGKSIQWGIMKKIRSGLLGEKIEYYKSAANEIKALRLAENIIGRTKWDKKLSMIINPSLRYYHCDEILRNVFYNGIWEYNKCKKYTIFHSNGANTLKGLHQIIKVFPYILRRYPEAQLIVAGNDVWKLADSGDYYAKIIVSMLRRKKLESKVYFCGNLDASAMKEQLLKSNVFILPSSIENSSNALAEAQLLGIPVIASKRGGTPTMIQDSRCGLTYQYHNVTKLAKLICKTFENSSNFDNTYMRDVARKRHEKTNNMQNLLTIYDECLTSR